MPTPSAKVEGAQGVQAEPADMMRSGGSPPKQPGSAQSAGNSGSDDGGSAGSRSRPGSDGSGSNPSQSGGQWCAQVPGIVLPSLVSTQGVGSLGMTLLEPQSFEKSVGCQSVGKLHGYDSREDPKTGVSHDQVLSPTQLTRVPSESSELSGFEAGGPTVQLTNIGGPEVTQIEVRGEVLFSVLSALFEASAMEAGRVYKKKMDKKISKKKAESKVRGRDTTGSQWDQNRPAKAAKQQPHKTPHTDAYKWRKYGQKTIRHQHGSKACSRDYYRCSPPTGSHCDAKKQVEYDADGQIVSVKSTAHTCTPRQAEVLLPGTKVPEPSSVSPAPSGHASGSKPTAD